MATFTNLENAHVFSKAVITPNMSAAAAGNTSAHTIQSKDIWAEKVPFLEKSALSGISADKEFKLDGYGTVKFHYKKNVYCLINSNNNDIPSNGYVGKIIEDGNTINQFISPTDVVNDSGQMATVYQPSLYGPDESAMPLSEYIINPSNGLIYDIKSEGNQGIFATSDSNGLTQYKLSFFTYEGDKLNDTIEQNAEVLSSHTSNNNIHITADERTKWDTAATKAATAVQDVVSGNAYLERGADNDNITLTLKVDTNLNDGATTNSVPSSTAVTNYGSSIISTHEAKKDGNKNIHVTAAERSSWDTAATKAATAIQTVKRANNSSALINVDQSGTSVSITLSDTIATKSELSTHTSNNGIHVSNEDRELWNKGGNLTISGDNFLNSAQTDAGWSLTLNNSTVIDSSDTHGDRKVPTVTAVKNYCDATITNFSNEITDNLTVAISGLKNYTDNAFEEHEAKWDGHIDNNNVHVTTAEKESWHRVAQNIDDLDSITTAAIIKNAAFTNYGNSEFKDIHVLPCLCLAEGAFLNNTTLETFICDMPNLANGTEMFQGCSKLRTFESCINNIAKAESMFEGCVQLVTVNLSKNSLSGLSHAARMFYGCSKLVNFKGDLSFLNDGIDMFKGCKLNIDSLSNIAYSIKSWNDNNIHNITIGLDPSINIEGEASSLIEEITSKGWTISYN